MWLLLVNDGSSREGVISWIKRGFNWLLAGRERGEWILITRCRRGGIHGVKDLEYFRSGQSGTRGKVGPSDGFDWLSEQGVEDLLVGRERFGC